MGENRVINRLDMYIKAKGLNDNRVTVMAGLANGALGQARKGKCDIGRKYIDKILSAFPDIDRVWLMTGEGNMINEPTITNNNSQVIGSNNTGSTVKVEANGSQIDAMLEMLKEQQRQNAEAQRQTAKLQGIMDRMLNIMENGK